MKRALWLGPAAVGLVILLFVGVFPTRTWLAQRRETGAAAARLDVLASQNRALAKRVRELGTDVEIERIAREQYNLVRPGEEAYAILPAPEAPPAKRRIAPLPKPRTFWDRITFWS